ncbi:NAD(P)H nitroreductase [Candidatus Epulonipiscium fishelsonii]|uniref:NAD(P)H nitroreductase n=1 Tax=Candidatus Epulonipiscium fishelsonii TaxID=77094 RepID=A0ACC8XD57_9FIRM|nr:NAD(P)H nitroreductase [Epulopiscium sp. SCG-B05WGA-EpuloA1]ONI40803.1 NAD(P)H nitroreductase [Epulopiscium sp. SCG-B11WGA-EpuloA1]
MDILNVLKTRYSTKEFDNTKTLTEKQVSEIEDLLQLSPSSTNIQPWHFVIATTNEGKKRITKATQGFFSFNKSKVLDASAVIIFASQTDLTEGHLQKVLEKEDKDGRFSQKKFKEQNHGARSIFANMHKFDYKDFQHWADKQVYLNLGNFLLGVAALGLDAIPMEGLDLKILDEEFGLREKGFTSSIVVAIGYHKDSDFNKDLPKSRLSKSEIIDRV